jgi:hypothetical protein
VFWTGNLGRAIYLAAAPRKAHLYGACLGGLGSCQLCNPSSSSSSSSEHHCYIATGWDFCICIWGLYVEGNVCRGQPRCRSLNTHTYIHVVRLYVCMGMDVMRMRSRCSVGVPGRRGGAAATMMRAAAHSGGRMRRGVRERRRSMLVRGWLLLVFPWAVIEADPRRPHAHDIIHTYLDTYIIGIHTYIHTYKHSAIVVCAYAV